MDSRTIRNGRAIRRRRECASCGHRFTTYELPQEEPLTVKKRSGNVEEYDRDKLLESVRVASAKRPVSLAELESLVDDVEETLRERDTREVSSARIGEMVMMRLRGLDQVAYVRFASVYRNFQDTEEFTEEVQDLLRRDRYRSAGQVELFSEDDDEGEEQE